MKKIIIGIAIVIIFCIAIVTGYIKSGYSSTELEALKKYGCSVKSILDTSELKNGKIILFTQEDVTKNGFTLNSAYVEKTSWGWKCKTVTGHGGSKQMSCGYYKLNDSISIITGYVIDDKIMEVRQSIDDNVTIAKLQTKDDVRFWLTVFPTKKDTILKINVIGRDGKELKTFELK